MRVLRKGSQAFLVGTQHSLLSESTRPLKLAGIRTRARSEAWAPGAIAELRVGCSRRVKKKLVWPKRGWRTTRGLPMPSPSNAFTLIPTPIHKIQAYLLPELLSQAQSGGATAATAPRSGGGDSLSPRLAPGRRRRGEGGARAAPGNRPFASERPPGKLRSRTRLPLI